MASVTFRQIRYFVAVAETGKISAAASMVGISPSAVTEAVGELTAVSGMKLFDRHPRGLTLTYEGHRLLAHCRNILSAVESAGYAMTRPTHDISGSIQLAVTITISGYFLAPLLARFRQRFPAIEVSIQEVKRSDIEAGLVSGKYELGLMLVSNLSKHADLVSHTLVRSMRRLWLPSKHPLLNAEIITLDDVARQPYIQLLIDDAESSNSFLLESSQARTQYRHANRIGRGGAGPDRVSKRGDDPVRHNVSAVVARGRPDRGSRGRREYSDNEHRRRVAPRKKPQSCDPNVRGILQD